MDDERMTPRVSDFLKPGGDLVAFNKPNNRSDCSGGFTLVGESIHSDGSQHQEHLERGGNYRGGSLGAHDLPRRNQ